MRTQNARLRYTQEQTIGVLQKAEANTNPGDSGAEGHSRPVSALRSEMKEDMGRT